MNRRELKDLLKRKGVIETNEKGEEKFNKENSKEVFSSKTPKYKPWKNKREMRIIKKGRKQILQEKTKNGNS